MKSRQEVSKAQMEFRRGVRAERRRVCKLLREFAYECANVPSGGKEYAWASTALTQAIRRIQKRALVEDSRGAK